MMLEFLGKGVKMTAEQLAFAKYVHTVTGKILDQASEDDESPLEISLGEVAQLAGEEIMGKLRGE